MRRNQSSVLLQESQRHVLSAFAYRSSRRIRDYDGVSAILKSQFNEAFVKSPVVQFAQA